MLKYCTCNTFSYSQKRKQILSNLHYHQLTQNYVDPSQSNTGNNVSSISATNIVLLKFVCLFNLCHFLPALGKLDVTERGKRIQRNLIDALLFYE